MYHPLKSLLASPGLIRGIGAIPSHETLFCSREDLGGHGKGEPEREDHPKNGIIRACKPWYVDLGLRVAGLCFLGIAALSIHVLMDIVEQAPQHLTTPLELVLAAVGFLGASLGSILLFLGARVYDRVVIASRWRMMR